MDDDAEIERLLAEYGIQPRKLEGDGEDDALPARWDEEGWDFT